MFAYIGSDIVATAAEETRDPKRDMPVGILGSLGICALLYVLVSLVMTGIVPYAKLNTAAPMATALAATGNRWATALVSLGAIVGLIAVMLMVLLGQSRVASRDRLLPPWLARVHPRLRSPYRITIATGAVVAVIATFTPILEVAELVNIGTLFAFTLISVGVLVLRRTRPDLHRAFRTPLVPWMPVLAVLASLYLMLNLTGWTWVRFGVWMVIGLAVYFGYSYRRSGLTRQETEGAKPER